MFVEIESPEQLAARLREGAGLEGVVVQGLDLRQMTRALLAASAAGATFLGCRFEQPALDHLVATGGVVFPPLEGLPYQPFRPRLYTPDELMEGYRRGEPDSFARDSLDARIYAHYDRYRRAGAALPVLEALAQRLHDHAVDDALQDFLEDGGRPRRVVGVMGGHALRRDSAEYAAAARLGWRLGRAGFLVATGGGPGAMEAANLGAFLSGEPEERLGRALELLAPAPTWHDAGWFDTAYEARGLGGGGDSLAVPTWFYGHEPTNLFATRVAKYFSNSLREDGLLALARHGVVYVPGSAGTVQEIFMDAAQNHYGTFGDVSPMVLLGRDYWTREKPVLALLEAMAAGRQYAERLALVDDPDAAADFVEAHPPIPYRRA